MTKRYMFGNFEDTNLHLGKGDLITIHVKENEGVLEALDKFLLIIRAGQDDRLKFKTINVGDTFAANLWVLSNGRVEEIIIENPSE